jgi:hypothetical protein
MPIPPRPSPEALAVATGAIISALLDILIRKKVLTAPEVRDALRAAMQGTQTLTPEGLQASQFIAVLLQHFPESF